MKSYKERTEQVMEKANVKIKKRKKITAICSAAGAAALLLAVNLTLFVPYTTGAYSFDISPYQGSEYFSVIQTLSGITNPELKGHKTNNYEQWFVKNAKDDAPMLMAPSSSGLSGGYEGDLSWNGNYEEVTDNQTAGIIEGDLFKRSDKYIFYLDLNLDYYGSGKKQNYFLEVYSIEEAESKQVSVFSIEPEEGMTFLNSHYYASGYYYRSSNSELYLSEDCSTVTVIAPIYASGVPYTMVVGVDVSDVNNIREIGRSYVSGIYKTSRMVDGSLLLVSNFPVRSRPDYSNESQFLPQTGKWGELKSLSLRKIICPTQVHSARYTVISSLDQNTFEVTDSVALLSYFGDVYVSADSLYVTQNYYTYESTYYGETEIYRISYGDGKLELKNGTTVPGFLTNRYCLDERDGVLRIVTTTRKKDQRYSASLYCYDVETLTQIATVERFSPEGEEVRSARFYGDIAYVCTAEHNAVKNTDPVFMFDLSDYQNITYKHTGTIPGYSLSLTAFKDDTLIGVGFGEWSSTLKIEVYKETDSEVVSVTEYVLDDTNFSEDYKAYFIDKESGLIGLAVRKRTEQFRYDYSYLVLCFDGSSLVELDLNIAFKDDYLNMNCVRACRVDNYLYVVSDSSYNSFHAIKLG